MKKRSILPYLIVFPYIIYLAYREYGLSPQSALTMLGVLGTIGATWLVYENKRKAAVPVYIISLALLAMTFFV